MRTPLLLSTLLICAPALASHPHDRVCVGTAKLPGQEPFDFVFQWEIERTYEQGHAEEDPHRLTLEARTCFEDSTTDSCSRFRDATVLAPKDRSGAASIKLRNKHGVVFFVGKLRFKDTEQLIGKMRRGPGAPGSSPATSEDALVDVTIPLSCVSQPFVSLAGQD